MLFSLKKNIAYVCDMLKVNDLFFLRSHGGIRAVNYHATKDLKNLEIHLRYFKQNFINVTQDVLQDFLDGRTKIRPRGLILTFDDGHVTNFKAAKLLEKYGFTGWFFVCPGRVSRKDHMSWEQLRYLSRKHVIGSHTMTHKRLGKSLSGKMLEHEIVGSRRMLEKNLGIKIGSFAWVGGESWTYSRAAARVISSNYNLSFQTNSALITCKTSPLHLQRSNIEDFYPIQLVRFQISGIMDLLYHMKRKKIEALTGLA